MDFKKVDSEEIDSSKFKENLPKTILLVEDEAIIALAESACLKRKGYSVLTAPSGEKAIELVNKDPSIDLILMDIDLGSGMDGTEAAKKILERHDIPIIFLSAHGEGEMVDRTFQIGSYGYILKNAGETVLLASLRMAFRLYDTHRKQQETERELYNLQTSYNSILQHAPVSILIVQNGIYTYANPYAASLLGYASPEELVGTPVLETIDPAYRQSIVERIKTIQQGTGNPPMRMKILRKDGSSLWTDSVSIPIDFRQSPAALVIGRDITATVAMEEKLKREADLHAELLALVEYSFSHTLQEVLQKTVDLVCDFTESPIGFFHFITEHSDGSQRIDLRAWSTSTLERYCNITDLSAHYPLPQAGVWADSARLKQPIIHNDFSKVSGKKGYPPGHPEILRELTVPIVRSGTCIAILGVGNKTYPYTEEDLEITARFADLAWEIVHRKNTELDLKRSEQEQRSLLL
jgi:PAS domain S-box-containing protein